MTLRVGDVVPDFTAIDSNGKVFDSRDVIGKDTVVLYFYPKDDTPGCTQQACSFRDNYEEFKYLGAKVIGVSSDSVNSHRKFISTYQLPFMLLSDEDNKLRRLFGVPKDYLGLIPGRATYIIDKNKVIQYIFDSTSANKHIFKAINFIKDSL